MAKARKNYAKDIGGNTLHECAAINEGNVKNIDLLFKTHLDLGYTDFASEIERKYFKNHIPKALALSREMRQAGDRRFVWTIGSYMLYNYLRQATPEETAELEDAIRHGDISWHALPLTTHTELMDESLLEFGISLSKELDRRFGVETIGAKMTDVPGHTIGMLPVLARNGIKFLHIGVNTSAAVPDVPDVFLWKDGDGNELVVMYSKNDYGATAAVEGCDTAVAFAHSGDNLGPQSVEQVRSVYEKLEQQYPGVKIEACGLNDFAKKIIKVKDTLPVVTGEIGDTWIQGTGTDPCKVSRYRTLMRLRTRWIEEGKLVPGTEEYTEFSMNLLCVPEHTWGMARYILEDYENYTKEQLAALRQEEKCHRVEESWKEQRAYTDRALQALSPALREEALAELAKLDPKPVDLKDYLPLREGERLHAGCFTIGFDSKTGAITHLKKDGNRNLLASEDHPIGEFMYEVFSDEDFQTYARHYIKNLRITREWSVPSFTKPGYPTDVPHGEHTAEAARLYYQKTVEGTNICAVLAMPPEQCEVYGCPREVTVEYFIPDDEPKIQLRLTWGRKDASRLGEALWLRINPKVKTPTLWKMDKVARMVSPMEVLRGGNRHLHCVKTGLYYKNGSEKAAIRTLDAPLVGMGSPAVVLFDRKLPSLQKGFYFNLFNNQWNTNFPYWYEDDAVFRFEVEF